MALDSLPCNQKKKKKKKKKNKKNPTVLINWRWRCGYKGRLEAIYFTSFDFDYHESKLAHVHHILDKFFI